MGIYNLRTFTQECAAHPKMRSLWQEDVELGLSYLRMRVSIATLINGGLTPTSEEFKELDGTRQAFEAVKKLLNEEAARIEFGPVPDIDEQGILAMFV